MENFQKKIFKKIIDVTFLIIKCIIIVEISVRNPEIINLREKYHENHNYGRKMLAIPENRNRLNNRESPLHTIQYICPETYPGYYFQIVS